MEIYVKDIMVRLPKVILSNNKLAYNQHVRPYRL